MGLFSRKKPGKHAGTATSGDPRYKATPAQRAEYARLRDQGMPPVQARQAALKIKK